MPYQISIRGEVYKKLVADLQRSERGRIQHGQLKARVDKIINDALDRAEGA